MRPNNFDLARLLLASMVVLFHCAALSGSPALHLLRSVDRHAAVEGFFVISGFLIFASYERCRSVADYARKRAARILPGYWLSTALCLAIVFAFTHRLHVLKFLIANLLFLNFLQPGVAGVFDRNPADAALNGSLWTIKIEVMFYVCVPLLVWLCRRFGRVPVLVACALLSVVYRHWIASNSTLAQQLPGQLAFFSMGALGYYYLPEFKRWGKYLVLPAAIAYLLQPHIKWFFLRPLSIPVLVLGFCFLL
ncbi:MAG TPA: acyltransferase, partial [Terriglobales bacterium]